MNENRKQTKGHEEKVSQLALENDGRKPILRKSRQDGTIENGFPWMFGYLYARENDRKKKGGQRKI